MIFELFYRDFDDSLLQRIAEISYENDVEDIPSPPDVSHYLVSEVSRDTCARLRVDNFWVSSRHSGSLCHFYATI